MTFNDIFKSKFLDKMIDISITDMVISFGIAVALGLFIFFAYKYTFGGVMYSRTFNVSLVGISVMTTFIILAVTSNVVLSLGMVGALSIVRFRTAIKDPMDLVFLFWSIGVGIVTGAQLYILAILGSVIIGVLMFLFSRKFMSGFESPYLVVINCENKSSAEGGVEIIKKHFKTFKMKSKIVSAGKGTEIIYEIKGGDKNTEFVDEISAVDGINSVSLVSYSGDFVE